MIELLVGGVVFLAIVLALGVVGSVLGALLWVVLLPLQLLGWAFKLAGWVIAAPFVLLAGLIGLAVVSCVVFAIALPLLPFVAVGLFLVWLARRGRSAPRTA